MKFFFRLLSLLLIINSTIISQNSINGRVIDAATNEPLPGANVFLQNTSIGVTSSNNGSFSLNIKESKNSEKILNVSFLGYHNYQYNIDKHSNIEIELLIPLKKSLLNLDQIVVTGTKTERFLKDSPVATRVISNEQISNSGASDIKQVLSEINGIVINENQFGTGVNTVEIQGFSSQHVQILVDGIKMIGRVNGQLDISEIPLTLVERIEIVKGSASALYGSEAMGGVINIITKNAQDNLSINSDLVGGSYGRFDGSIGINYPISNWKPYLNLSYRKYGGYDLNEKTDSEDGTAYDKYQGQLSITGDLKNNFKLSFNTLFLEEEHTVRSSTIFEDYIKNQHFAGRAELNKKELFSNLNFKTGIEYSQYEHRYDKKVISSGFYRYGDVTKENLFRGDIQADYSLGINKINGGYSVEFENIDSDRVIGKKQKSTLHNIFIQNEIEANDWLTILGGVRLDAHSVYGEQLSPKLSLMSKPSTTSRIRLSFAKGFRAPTFKELFIEYINLTVGYHIEGNPELQPEKSNSYQADFEYWNNSNYHLRFHVFFNNISNLIDYEYLGIIETYGTYRTQNLSKVDTWGGDIEAEFFPFDFLNCKIGYSYFDSWDSDTDNALSFKSKHKLNFAIKLNFVESFSVNLRGQFFGEQEYWSEWDEFTKTGTRSRIKSYLLLHTNANYQLFEHLSIYAGLRNITDYVNKTWGPRPGREWYAGLRYSWQKDK